MVDETGKPAKMPQLKSRPVQPIRSRPTRTAKKAVRRPPARDEVLLRQRRELEELVAEAASDHADAEADREKALSELDANEHHVSDMHTAIERLTAELSRARQELQQAQARTAALERAARRTARVAEKAKQQLERRRQHLDSFGS